LTVEIERAAGQWVVSEAKGVANREATAPERAFLKTWLAATRPG
jgi:hypothetical protein